MLLMSLDRLYPGVYNQTDGACPIYYPLPNAEHAMLRHRLYSQARISKTSTQKRSP